MNRSPMYLPILHEIESKYGSISRAPESEVTRVQEAIGLEKSRKRGSYERGRQWQRFFRELNTEELTSHEILLLAQKDSKLSENNTRAINMATVHAQARKYEVKYKRTREM
ncbi:Uncharacterised protein [Levilactobacillus brevis]|nr:Uncharacterised protein [Levilactobacillus brevis]